MMASVERGTSRALQVATSLILLVLLVAVVLVAVTTVSARSRANADRKQISVLQQENNMLTAGLKTLQGTSQGSTDLSSLETQITQLTSQLAALTDKNSSVTADVAKICQSQAIASERANLNGEATGSNDENSQYYEDLDNIISSICGPDE
jgi:cell division protein FtsB